MDKRTKKRDRSLVVLRFEIGNTLYHIFLQKIPKPAFLKYGNQYFLFGYLETTLEQISIIIVLPIKKIYIYKIYDYKKVFRKIAKICPQTKFD